MFGKCVVHVYTQNMVTQVFSITNIDDAIACAKAGVDNIGVRVGAGTVPWEISINEAIQIKNSIISPSNLVVISNSSSISELLQIVVEVQPAYIQTLADLETLDMAARTELYLELKNHQTKLISGLPLKDRMSIKQAQGLSQVTDIIILETVTPGKLEMGATGELNDWNLAAELIKTVDRPIIMSGGLGPHNVAECIRATNPWGVDSMTGTDIDGSDHMKKDIKKVEDFVTKTKSAISQYHTT